jgi:Xaa-Pro aminopeptidase
MRLFILCSIFIVLACTPSDTSTIPYDWGPSPWPEIRKERISSLLPNAMKASNVDAWLVICRENDNDPMADHIGGENAGGTAVFIFFMDENGFNSIVFSPIGESTALDELDIHDVVVPVARGASAIEDAAKYIREKNFNRIAINTSNQNKLADGLSHSQYLALTESVGDQIARTFTSSEQLVYEWLSVKLPAEVEIMRKAAELTAAWQLEAYATIQPGITTDADVAAYLDEKMIEYGVGEAWAPDQNPNVNSGADRGHSHATQKVIMPGDVIQTDFGIRVYDRWVTDIQRFAYVLKQDEKKPPVDIQFYWESGRDGSKVAFSAMKPGVRGEDVDAAQRALMKENGSEYVMWSTGHPVGYVAHDAGPNLGGSHIPGQRPSAQLLLKPGMVFAFDGFHAWTLEDGGTKTISVEEMAVITDDGAEYLIPPQEELVLIGGE